MAIPVLSLLFAISFKFFRTSKKVVINGFCCFLFLNYGKKVRLLRVPRLIRFSSRVFLGRHLQKQSFCLKFDFTTIFKLLHRKTLLKNWQKIFLGEPFQQKKTPAVNPMIVLQAIDEWNFP